MKPSRDLDGNQANAALPELGAHAVPMLHWAFVRDTERVHSQLSLDQEHLLYEWRTRRVGAPANAIVERYLAVSQAFQRQSTFQRALLDDGWSLEHQDSCARE